MVKPSENLFNAMKCPDFSWSEKRFSSVLQLCRLLGKIKKSRTDKVQDCLPNELAHLKLAISDERFTISKILVDGNMASVWVPYQFYYKGNFSHCGVNSFQLAKINNEWKIQYVIDTRRNDNCIQSKIGREFDFFHFQMIIANLQTDQIFAQKIKQ